MIRQPTLCELAALDVLTRQLDAIRDRFQDERLSQRRDVAEREAHRLGRDPFVLGSGDAARAPAVARMARMARTQAG